MTSHDGSRRPRLVDGIDLRHLPLSPQEAFVLSRVDGSVTESELVLLTGLQGEHVARALDRLASLGALSFAENVPLTSSGIRVSRPSGTLRIGPIVEMRAGAESHHPAAALYDPAELDEAIDLDVAKKRKVLDLYYRLDKLNHYELLGIPRDADKKAVKAAYYEVVNVFHPDRYYGKQLGTYKAKLERAFARITEAHDVLTRQQARNEYDLYLDAQARTRALDKSLGDLQSPAREAERIEREIAEQARAAEHAAGQYPTPSEGLDRVPPSVPPSPEAWSTPSQRPLDPDARRRALARKLGVSVPPTRSSSPAADRPSSPSIKPSVPRHAAAADELRRRYEHRVLELKRRQIERYTAAADQALASGDLISASNALKIAVGLAPEDPALRARLEEVQAKASATLAASYLEQARYEEREGRFAEAARSYERVARAKPNPRVFERTAHCLLASKGDLRVAAEWAKKAVAAQPDDASLRVTLARIYLEAGLGQSAVAEFERAATLSPKDDTIKDWLKRAKAQ